MSDTELNAFQQRCFGTSLQNRALEDVRTVVRRHTNDGVGPNGLTLPGDGFISMMITAFIFLLVKFWFIKVQIGQRFAFIRSKFWFFKTRIVKIWF